MEPKYYFIYYSCYRRSWRPDGTCQSSTTTMNQYITDKHPIEWQLECNEKYSIVSKNEGQYTSSEEYTVVSWQVLTLDEYKRFKGKVG